MKLTPEEARDAYLDQIRRLVAYWSSPHVPANQSLTDRERCDGLVHSILNLLDGMGDLPPVDLVVRTDDPDDRFEDDTLLPRMLHEAWGH